MQLTMHLLIISSHKLFIYYLCQEIMWLSAFIYLSLCWLVCQQIAQKATGRSGSNFLGRLDLAQPRSDQMLVSKVLHLANTKKNCSVSFLYLPGGSIILGRGCGLLAALLLLNIQTIHKAHYRKTSYLNFNKICNFPLNIYFSCLTCCQATEIHILVALTAHSKWHNAITRHNMTISNRGVWNPMKISVFGFLKT